MTYSMPQTNSSMSRTQLRSRVVLSGCETRLPSAMTPGASTEAVKRFLVRHRESESPMSSPSVRKAVEVRKMAAPALRPLRLPLRGKMCRRLGLPSATCTCESWRRRDLRCAHRPFPEYTPAMLLAGWSSGHYVVEVSGS